MSSIAPLKIGEVAKQTGVSVGTLRYYESLQLLPSAKRGDNGYRYYDRTAIEQVEFIRQAQSLGFSLSEIRQIMNARHLDDGPCELVKDLLQQKINQLSLQAHRILAFKAELEGYRDRWLTLQIQPLTDEICPLIATVEVPDAAEQPDRPSLVGAVGEQPGLTLRDYPR